MIRRTNKEVNTSTSSSSDKTLISWSKPDLFQNIITDAAIAQNSSKSAIIEECVRAHFFGKKNITNDFITNFLYSPEGSLQHALYAIFSHAYGYINFKNLNLEPFMKYTLKLFVMPNDPMNLTKDSWIYIDTYMRVISEEFSNIIKYEKPGYDTHACREAGHMIEFLRNLLSEDLHNCGPVMIDMINLLLSRWEIVQNWPSTYGFMQAIAKRAAWQTTPSLRNELRQIIVSTCDDWEE